MPSQELSYFSIAVEHKNIFFTFCQKSLIKVALKILQNSKFTPLPEFRFLRKLQDACKFSEIFKGNVFARHLQTANSEFHDFSEEKTF